MATLIESEFWTFPSCTLSSSRTTSFLPQRAVLIFLKIYNRLSVTTLVAYSNLSSAYLLLIIYSAVTIHLIHGLFTSTPCCDGVMSLPLRISQECNTGSCTRFQSSRSLVYSRNTLSSNYYRNYSSTFIVWCSTLITCSLPTDSAVPRARLSNSTVNIDVSLFMTICSSSPVLSFLVVFNYIILVLYMRGRSIIAFDRSRLSEWLHALKRISTLSCSVSSQSYQKITEQSLQTTPHARCDFHCTPSQIEEVLSSTSSPFCSLFGYSPLSYLDNQLLKNCLFMRDGI